MPFACRKDWLRTYTNMAAAAHSTHRARMSSVPRRLNMGSLRGPPAIDGIRGTRDGAGRLTRQEHCERTDLFGLGVAGHRLLLGDEFQLRVVERLPGGLRARFDLLRHKGSHDPPRADRVAGDAVACGLDRHPLGQPDDAVLG